jgi:hypothetical protein
VPVGILEPASLDIYGPTVIIVVERCSVVVVVWLVPIEDNIKQVQGGTIGDIEEVLSTAPCKPLEDSAILKINAGAGFNYRTVPELNRALDINDGIWSG